MTSSLSEASPLSTEVAWDVLSPGQRQSMASEGTSFRSRLWGAGVSVFQNFDHHVDDDEGEGREVRLITGKIRKILVASGIQTARALLEI